MSGVYADDWIEVGKLKPIISKKIIFIRHGNSVWNEISEDNKAKAIRQGFSEVVNVTLRGSEELSKCKIIDAPLSDVGLEEVDEFSKFLENELQFRLKNKKYNEKKLKKVKSHIKEVLKTLAGEVKQRGNVPVNKSPGISVANLKLSFALQELREYSKALRPAIIQKKGMDDTFINEQILIDYLLEPKNSIVCCSNLRRAISTTILGLKPRFDAYPEEKVHILSCMQEFGLGVDTKSILVAGGVPEVSEIELNSENCKYPEYLHEFYENRLESGENYGNKTDGDKVRQITDVYNFCGWAFHQKEHETIIAVGHSLWFKTFFNALLPKDFYHPCKDFKIENCGAVGFRLLFNPNALVTKSFAIDPKSIKNIYRLYEYKKSRNN